jgi:hypothetical protein
MGYTGVIYTILYNRHLHNIKASFKFAFSKWLLALTEAMGADFAEDVPANNT